MHWYMSLFQFIQVPVFFDLGVVLILYLLTFLFCIFPVLFVALTPFSATYFLLNVAVGPCRSRKIEIEDF